MSVDLQFKICTSSNCKKMTFYELTGAFSTSNPGGWGSPNYDTTDAEDATLEITDPDGNTTTLDLTLVTPTFPTTNLSQGYEFTPSDIGSTEEKFTDGKYTFTYTVSRTSATAFSDYEVVQQLIYCQAKCCVRSLFAQITDFKCDCKNTKLELALRASALLEGLKYAADCGQEDTFNTILETINSLCDTEDCNCGCS